MRSGRTAENFRDVCETERDFGGIAAGIRTLLHGAPSPKGINIMRAAASTGDMIPFFQKLIQRMFGSFFSRKKNFKLGLYGPPNGGKTTLANRICKDWLGEEMGSVSHIAHETREIQIKEEVKVVSNGKTLVFNLVDTPGIATKIDYEEFVKEGLPEEEAKQRAREATKGVIDAIKWLDEMDAVMICRLNHPGRDGTGGAVESGKGLIQLGHVAADAGRLLNQVDEESFIGYIESGLHAGDAGADDENLRDNITYIFIPR